MQGNNKVYAAIDIGGTAIKAGIVTQQAAILEWFEQPANLNGYQIPFVQAIAKAAQKLNQLAQTKHYQLQAVGVSATGQINGQTGKVIGSCGNIPGWIGTDLRAMMEGIFGLPTMVENDANCALLGEHWNGAGIGHQDIIAYTIGTGIGGGILSNGQLLTGARGIGGELGHMIIIGNGRPCTCGNQGCFEQYGSMTALIREAQKATGLQNLNGLKLFQMLDEQLGNEMGATLQRLIDQFLDYQVMALTGLVHIFNPSLIIVGGGISHQGEKIIAPLRKRLKRAVMPRFGEQLEVLPAKLGNQAGMIGAVRAAITQSQRA